MQFIDNLNKLRSERNISKNKFLKDLSLAAGSFGNWETRGSLPNSDTLKKIADYFDVSVDYLLGKEKKLPGVDEELAQDVSRFIQLLQGMSQEQKENLFRLMESMQEK